MPQDKLSLREALVLMRVRWQIELIFKLWKSHGKVDQWRSANPWRILCETYAKLTAMVVQHWLLLIGCWTYPDRSLVKASAIVRSHVLTLVEGFVQIIDLTLAIERIQARLATCSRLNRRKEHPNTYQLLLELTQSPQQEAA